MGVLDRLGTATAAQRTVELILDEALNAQWRGYQAQLAKAADSDVETGSLARPATTEISLKMDEIRDQVEASTITFAFEKLDWRVRVRVQAEHPPREGNRLDNLRGYNIETYTPAIIRASCVSVTDTEGDTATEIPDDLWDKLLGVPGSDVKADLGYAQVDQLYRAATEVNDTVTAVPPSARFLRGSQDSGASLAQPGPGTSPPSASAAGSRRGSRKSSSATKKADPAA
jgi:hypothetical protein